MTTLTISIIIVFVLGYALIATESLTKVNKAAIALLMLVGCWTLYMVDPMQYLQMMHPDYTGGAAGMVEKVTGIIQEHLGDTATTLFFLMGAMTIVEIVDQNGGFNWVRKVMKTKSKRALLWRIAFLTFFLSAILDNLTTSIVMIMILRKLVTDHKDRMIYASLVIIAANSGGAFSPIGDVTTIMLWNKGLITAAGVIAEIFIPIVEAYKRGCYFDGWEECFKYDTWMQTFADLGIDPAFYCQRPIALDEVTPWSHMDYGITHEYLVREYNKALAAQTTPPCNRACNACGANHLLGGPCFDYSQNLV